MLFQAEGPRKTGKHSRRPERANLKSLKFDVILGASAPACVLECGSPLPLSKRGLQALHWRSPTADRDAKFAKRLDFGGSPPLFGAGALAIHLGCVFGVRHSFRGAPKRVNTTATAAFIPGASRLSGKFDLFIIQIPLDGFNQFPDALRVGFPMTVTGQWVRAAGRFN